LKSSSLASGKIFNACFFICCVVVYGMMHIKLLMHYLGIPKAVV